MLPADLQTTKNESPCADLDIKSYGFVTRNRNTNVSNICLFLASIESTAKSHGFYLENLSMSITATPFRFRYFSPKMVNFNHFLSFFLPPPLDYPILSLSSTPSITKQHRQTGLPEAQVRSYQCPLKNPQSVPTVYQTMAELPTLHSMCSAT